MRTWVACLATLAIVRLAAGAASGRRADKNSVELIVRGCLKGRDLTATEISGPETVRIEAGRMFRVSGKRDVKDALERQNGRFVEVTGTMKKAALLEPGLKIGKARIVIGSSPASHDPTRNPARNPELRILPLDATSVRMVAEACVPSL